MNRRFLTYMAGPPGATFDFADRLAVRPEAFLGFAAPVKATRELVVLLDLILMVHFLVSQKPTGNANIESIIFVIHAILR